MTDVSFLSDRGNAFEATFREYGYTCQQVQPQAFGSPFCPPTKLLIVPSGFADPKYYRILPALERNKDKIEEFLQKGGTVLAFGAMLTDYEYTWLPMKLKYHMHFKNRSVKLVNQSSPAALLVGPGQKDCDGYFTEHDGETVMVIDDGTPVLVHKQIGKGFIVACALHEFPEKNFIDQVCSKDRPLLVI